MVALHDNINVAIFYYCIIQSYFFCLCLSEGQPLSRNTKHFPSQMMLIAMNAIHINYFAVALKTSGKVLDELFMAIWYVKLLLKVLYP